MQDEQNPHTGTTLFTAGFTLMMLLDLVLG
jgi:zinc transporter ZupT